MIHATLAGTTVCMMIPGKRIDAIPGIRRVEMLKSRDRSFCCGGGGLMLFYEPEEEERMGVLRVEMAAKAGANVIVTACPVLPGEHGRCHQGGRPGRKDGSH
jgi:hypothetical protein